MAESEGWVTKIEGRVANSEGWMSKLVAHR